MRTCIIDSQWWCHENVSTATHSGLPAYSGDLVGVEVEDVEPLEGAEVLDPLDQVLAEHEDPQRGHLLQVGDSLRRGSEGGTGAAGRLRR